MSLREVKMALGLTEDTPEFDLVPGVLHVARRNGLWVKLYKASGKEEPYEDESQQIINKWVANPETAKYYPEWYAAARFFHEHGAI